MRRWKNEIRKGNLDLNVRNECFKKKERKKKNQSWQGNLLKRNVVKKSSKVTFSRNHEASMLDHKMLGWKRRR